MIEFYWKVIGRTHERTVKINFFQNWGGRPPPRPLWTVRLWVGVNEFRLRKEFKLLLSLLHKIFN